MLLSLSHNPIHYSNISPVIEKILHLVNLSSSRSIESVCKKRQSGIGKKTAETSNIYNNTHDLHSCLHVLGVREACVINRNICNINESKQALPRNTIFLSPCISLHGGLV